MPSCWCHTYDSFYDWLFLHTLTLLHWYALWFWAWALTLIPPLRGLWPRGRNQVRAILFLSLSPFFTRRWYALCVGSCKCINRERIAPAVLLNVADSWGTGFARSDHSLISSSSLHFPGIVIYECSFIWLRLNMSTHRWRYHSTYFLCIVTCAIT